MQPDTDEGAPPIPSGYSLEPIELADIDVARIEAIRRIWAILARESDGARCMNRQIKVTNELGAVLLVVTFADVVCPTRLASC